MFGKECFSYSKWIEIEFLDSSPKLAIIMKTFDVENNQVSVWGIKDIVISLYNCSKNCKFCSPSSDSCSECYPGHYISQEKSCIEECLSRNFVMFIGVCQNS